MEERLTTIETKLAYLEDFLNQIQQVTVEQTKEIEKLRHDKHILEERLQEIFDNMEADIPTRKPPHY